MFQYHIYWQLVLLYKVCVITMWTIRMQNIQLDTINCINWWGNIHNKNRLKKLHISRQTSELRESHWMTEQLKQKPIGRFLPVCCCCCLCVKNCVNAVFLSVTDWWGVGSVATAPVHAQTSSSFRSLLRDSSSRGSRMSGSCLRRRRWSPASRR